MTVTHPMYAPSPPAVRDISISTWLDASLVAPWHRKTTTNLGWYPQDSLSPGAKFEAGTSYGQHGYNPEFEEMHSIFYAVGPGLKNKVAHNVRNIDVAPTIAALLGIDGPADADGRVLSEILR
jgi:predicted AlkP superfamily phosphohydrolase/phosphomutase